MSEVGTNQRGEYSSHEPAGVGGWGVLIGIGALGIGAVLLVRHEARDYEARMRGFNEARRSR